jgi:hypothetical protein
MYCFFTSAIIRNMKTTLSFLLSMLCLCLVADAQTAPKATPARPKAAAVNAEAQKKRAMAGQKLMARLGGMVESPATGPALVIVDTQKRVPFATVEQFDAQVQKILRLSCSTAKEAADEPFTVALKFLADTNTAAVVVLGDSPKYPALLIAPENRWALVNVAALATDGVTSERLAERTQKELWRAFGYVMGAANTTTDFCPMKSVRSLADIDGLKSANLAPELFNKILLHAQTLGMRPARRTPYRKAVEEGWAPPPTNDIQRAIWDELKKKP